MIFYSNKCHQILAISEYSEDKLNLKSAQNDKKIIFKDLPVSE